MIRFVVALASEARPIVERYRMEPVEGALPMHRGPDATLIISGVGKRAAAAATAYLQAKTEDDPDGPWINVGVAGHGNREPGELVVAHTVVDEQTGERWYPPRLALQELDAEEVRTVDEPEMRFPSGAVYDMEASGFYPTALSFSTAELVQCLKIVSDNRTKLAGSVTAALLTELIGEHIGSLSDAADSLSGLARELVPMPQDFSSYRAFCRRFRLSTSEARRLRRLLGRFQALAPESVPSPEQFPGTLRASELLQQLDQDVEALALKTSPFRDAPR